VRNSSECLTVMQSTFVFGAILLTFVALATRANSVVLPGTANVSISGPISITETANLDFGAIVPPTLIPQIFELDANTGSITPLGVGGGQTAGGHQRGEFDIDGDDGRDYFLIVAPSVSGPTGTCDTSELDLISMEANLPPGGLPRVLDESIFVGGSLLVNATTPPGNYTCQYQVLADYI